MRSIALVMVLLSLLVPSCLESTTLPPEQTVLAQARHDDLLEDALRLDMIIEETLTPGADEVESMTAYELYRLNPEFVKLKKLRKKDVIQLVLDVSRAENINPAIVLAIVHRESHFNIKALSPKGAFGLMQLMPATAAELGVDIKNPVENVIGGIRYFKAMRAKFMGYTTLGLAAYNAGPGAVKRHNGIPPYTETQDYVVAVYEYYHKYSKEIEV